MEYLPIGAKRRKVRGSLVFCVGLEFVFWEEKLSRWWVMVADEAVKDSGWRTGRYHRIYIYAVVSGSDVQGRKANRLLIPRTRSEGDLMKLAFGVSSGGLETCFWCKLWGCRNLLLVL